MRHRGGRRVRLIWLVLCLAAVSLVSAGIALADTTTPPSKPTDAQATAGDNTATTTIAPSDPSDNVLHYVVQRSTDNGANWSDLATDVAVPADPTARPSYTDATAKNGTSVEYRWIAVNTTGPSDPSDATPAVTPQAPPPPPPSKPTDAQATAGDNTATTTIAPSDPSDNVLHYVVQRSADNGANWSDLATDVAVPADPTARPSYTDATATNDTTYEYRWIAVNTTGPSDPSDATPAVTPQAPPAKPTGAQATAGNNTATTSVDHPASGDSATHYIVQRSTDNGAHWSDVAPNVAVPAGTTARPSYTDATAANGTTYEYRWIAVNSNGGQSPAAVTGPVKPLPPAPSAPVLDGQAGNGLVYLHWIGSAGPGGHFIINGGKWSTSDNQTLIAASNGVPVTYTVQAVDKYGRASKPSNSVTLTPKNPPPPPDRTAPPAPQLTARAGEHAVRLSYTKTAPDVAGFLVYQQKSGQWAFLGQTLGMATTVLNLTPGQHFTFAVKALDKSGNISPLSSSATATPYDHVAPAAVGSLRATRLVHRARLSWRKSSASDHRTYRVQGKSSAGGRWRARAVLYRATSWRSGALSCRHPSWYRVRDVDRYGNAGSWRTVKVTPRCR